MNAVLHFIERNGERLGLQEHGLSARPSCVIRTGQSRTSSHVVALLLDGPEPRPRVVAKVTRLPAVTVSMESEASNLRAVHAARPGGFDSIPRVIAFEDYHGGSMLLLSALEGTSLEPALRRDRDRACRAVTRWLTELHQVTGHVPASGADWYDTLVDGPLRHFRDVFPLSPQEVTLVRQTQSLAEALRESRLPLVFEHGDLCCPNILLLNERGAGVVDWELAEPRGLPACDLFFFLANAGFARHRAYATGAYLPAFREAFFDRPAWARDYVSAYAEAVGLEPGALTPLFVLCWARYTDNLLRRLSEARCPDARPGPGTVAWLRAYRYYALWQHAIANLDQLAWDTGS